MASSVINSAASVVDSATKGVMNTAKRQFGTAPPPHAYLPWNAPGVETVQEDEESKAHAIASTMKKMQQHNFDQHRHAFRATHVKTQSILKGSLTVPDDLPTHLRQGLFTHGGTYPVVVRYANEPVWLQPDTSPGPRGLSLRIFNVPGERIKSSGNDNLTTQDFLFNNAPMLELTDIDTCLDIMQLRERLFDSPTRLSLANSTRTDALKQNAPFSLPNTNIISMSFYTQSAFRFGQFYGHIGLFPATEPMQSHSESVPSDAAPTVLSDWLADFYKDNEAVYDIRIQLGTDPIHHPTEDASVVWDESTAPWQTIGRLTLPKQTDLMSPQRRTFWEEHMRLNAWQGLDAHRPLGSINRLRRYVYEASAKKRLELNAANGVNVASIDQIP